MPYRLRLLEGEPSHNRLRQDQEIRIRQSLMSHYALLPRILLYTLDFGSWLEPRYIFAAGQLI